MSIEKWETLGLATGAVLLFLFSVCTPVFLIFGTPAVVSNALTMVLKSVTAGGLFIVVLTPILLLLRVAIGVIFDR